MRQVMKERWIEREREREMDRERERERERERRRDGEVDIFSHLPRAPQR
jgi:hypothetical protein